MGSDTSTFDPLEPTKIVGGEAVVAAVELAAGAALAFFGGRALGAESG